MMKRIVGVGATKFIPVLLLPFIITSSAQVTGSYWSLCQYPINITIWRCDALSSLIPWYALGQMKRLQELKIENCSKMMEVFEGSRGGPKA
ncbi:hypothetical protein HanPI659440_Chr15g0592361 [Helianthus annuus]|nr:hypothetical protein HanPI659440_Chr15g0592361 [Helianthus annuus]